MRFVSLPHNRGEGEKLATLGLWARRRFTRKESGVGVRSRQRCVVVKRRSPWPRRGNASWATRNHRQPPRDTPVEGYSSERSCANPQDTFFRVIDFAGLRASTPGTVELSPA
jgi:hypothetical protein